MCSHACIINSNFFGHAHNTYFQLQLFNKVADLTVRVVYSLLARQTMDLEKLKKMSVIDLSMWLKESGVQDCYCELFEGKNYTAACLVAT